MINMGYHYISTSETGDWYQDDKTGMFFQFLKSSWKEYKPPKAEESQEALRKYILERYGNPLAAYIRWSSEKTSHWYSNGNGGEF
jgi:hypothetical protein